MNKKEIEKNVAYLFNLESSLSREDKEKIKYILMSKRDKFLFDLKNKKLDYGKIIKILRNNKDYCDDYDVVLEAIKNNGLHLRYASDKIKDDEKIVLKAVKKNGYVLEYASKRLKDNEDIVLSAVKRYGYALRHASERLRDNENIVLEAIKDDKDILFYASLRLQEKLYK